MRGALRDGWRTAGRRGPWRAPGSLDEEEDAAPDPHPSAHRADGIASRPRGHPPQTADGDAVRSERSAKMGRARLATPSARRVGGCHHDRGPRGRRDRRLPLCRRRPATQCRVARLKSRRRRARAGAPATARATRDRNALSRGRSLSGQGASLEALRTGRPRSPPWPHHRNASCSHAMARIEERRDQRHRLKDQERQNPIERVDVGQVEEEHLDDGQPEQLNRAQP